MLYPSQSDSPLSGKEPSALNAFEDILTSQTEELQRESTLEVESCDSEEDLESNVSATDLLDRVLDSQGEEEMEDE